MKKHSETVLTSAVNVASESKGNSQDVLLDVIILGAGPAGISCALELNETRVNLLIVERKSTIGGQLQDIPSAIPNLAIGWFDNGQVAQDGLRSNAERAALTRTLDEEIIDCDLNEKTLRSKTKTYKANSLFLATGYRLKRLHDEERYAKFRKDIIYRSGNSQADFVDKNVVVIGGGDSAMYEAMERAKTARKVTIVNRSDKFRASSYTMQEAHKSDRIEWLKNFEIAAMSGKDRLEEISFRSTTDGTTINIPADKLVVKIGYAPNTEIFSGQIDMDSSGHIRIESDCSTSVRGVFAGGDMVTPGFDRIAVAMGHGMIAAKSISEYLSNENRRLDPTK